jgi:pyruvate-ferredoxin/flavodoxin oxidoreductase
MSESMTHQKLAVTSGHWPLFRYRPSATEGSPFQLDSRAPSIPYAEFARKEARFGMLFRSDPNRAKELLARSEADIAERWRYYEQLAGVSRSAPPPDPAGRRARLAQEGESDE